MIPDSIGIVKRIEEVVVLVVIEGDSDIGRIRVCMGLQRVVNRRFQCIGLLPPQSVLPLSCRGVIHAL